MENLNYLEKATLSFLLRKKMEDSQWMVDQSKSGEEIKAIFRKDVLELKEIARKLEIEIA